MNRGCPHARNASGEIRGERTAAQGRFFPCPTHAAKTGLPTGKGEGRPGKKNPPQLADTAFEPKPGPKDRLEIGEAEKCSSRGCLRRRNRPKEDGPIKKKGTVKQTTE